MERNSLFALLKECEARLAESLKITSEALNIVRAACNEIDEPDSIGSGILPVRQNDKNPDELIQLVLAALEKSPKSRPGRDAFMYLLVYREDENAYRIGRRKLGLTDTEKQILDLLWNAMPNPASRDQIYASLYSQGSGPNPGTIDVFMSKLRQKLKLASNGHDFIESVRGKGWNLKSRYCRHAREPDRAEIPSSSKIA